MQSAKTLDVFHVLSSVSKGGMELFPVMLAKAQLSSKIHATLVAHGTGFVLKYARESHVPVFGIKGQGSLFRRLLEVSGPRAVFHVHYPKDLFVASLVRRLKPQVRLVFTKHSASKGTKTDPYHRFLVSSIDAFVANSKFLAHNSSVVYGIPEERIPVVYYGLDEGRIPKMPGEARVAVRAKHAIPKDAFVFGVVAQYSRSKCQDVFLKAIALLLSSLPKGRARPYFLMAGPEADRGFLDELKALAASLGIQDQVRFLDFQANVGPVFASLDCLVLPSKQEAFGIVLLEAMALGKPCIVTRAGGAIEAVEEGKAGLWVEPLDEKGLAGAMVRLLQEPKLSESLGAFATLWVRERFSMARCVEEYQRVYENLFA